MMSSRDEWDLVKPTRRCSRDDEVFAEHSPRILPWGQAYLNHQKAFRRRKFQVTEFRVVTEW